MNYLVAACLGILQGVTEFLPVSSTAHLLLAARASGFADPGGVFTVTIQFGSILAVMWLYRAKIVRVVLGLRSDPEARRFALMVLLAFLPALVAGAVLSPFVHRVLYESPRVFAAAFILGGVAMLVVERVRPVPTVQVVERTPYTTALGIGACQTLALVPGVSRSGATLAGGMILGLDRPAAAEFSFFLAMPTMTAAFVHDLVGVQVQGALTPERGVEVAIGFVLAFVASAVVVRPFVTLLARTGLRPFAWYRIGLGVAVLAAIAGGWL